jgi:multiple sugar transport system substrate-binding protein
VAPSYGTADNTLWNTVVADFHAANPGITVDVQQEQSRSSLPTTAIPAGTVYGADVMVGVPTDSFDGRDLSTFYSAGELEPPGNDLLPSFSYAENAIGADGKSKQIGIPFTGTNLEFFYNKLLFAKAHIAKPPATWNDILVDAKKINALGMTGYGLPMGPNDIITTTQLWAKGNGGGFMNAAKTTWTVNQSANVDTLQWLEANLINPGLSQFTTFASPMSNVKQDFADGILGMVVADPGLIKQAEAGKVGAAFGVTRIPGRYGPMSYSLGWVDDIIATRAHPEDKAAIAKFVAFLLQPKYQKQFADLAGTVPVTRSGVAAEGQNPLLKPFLDAMPTVDWLPTHAPGWKQLQDKFDNTGAQINDPKTFLDQAQALATARQ